ncbi:MAG: TPM domain-containing protein [Chitinophagaceae bacterium]|jgi:uncharacterized membrane protein|nr:TPM domain-containing protein [Chitinophagaceae bacterium]OQY94900.1 MAG: hypothetical protein B6D37_07185 [Sphingobacteriales bacterium UTBCD1]
MIPFIKRKKKFFTEEEHQKILQSIRQAEKETSGEIRVFIESKCSYVDALDRAKEIFEKLNMHHTAERNAVLIYVAVKHHQLAIYGDDNIHKKVGGEYWKKMMNRMEYHFRRSDYAEGIRQTITEVGKDLQKYFPHHKYIDKNELPDDIVSGS